MKPSLFFTLILFFVFNSCKKIDGPDNSLPPEILSNAQAIFGGSNEDFFTSLVEVGGYIFHFGSTLSEGNSNGDLFLVKTDRDGNKLWKKSYGLENTERGNQILKTNDGNLYLLGSTESIGNGKADIFLLKVDLEGNLLWEKTFGSVEHEIPSHFIETSNSELCIAATQFKNNTSNIYLIWTDLSGNFLREKIIGSSFNEGSTSIIEATNKDLYVFGYSERIGSDSRNFMLLKTSLNGDSLWSKTYGGNGYEESSTFLETPNNNFLLIGHSASTDLMHNMYVLKVNSTGAIVWEKNYGGSNHDGAEGGMINSDGNYVFLGISNSFGNGSEAILLITTDQNGIQISEEFIQNDFGMRGDDLIQLNNYYYIAGRIKSEANGNNDGLIVRRIK